MGVILRVLHRSEGLNKAEFRNMFLDMEENIHIHYRDLRIELSRKEFEDIVNTFSKQSAELMAIIRATNYQDGILPNANHEEKRIWTESRLENEVVYHPQRLSLEECTDGYHLHLRNYKFLLSKEDFGVFVKAVRDMDVEQPFASTFKGILELLDANHLHYNVKEEGCVAVAHYHEPKVRSILTGIGMERVAASAEAQTYTKNELKIEMEISRDRADFADRFEGVPHSIRPLTDVLLEKKDAPDPDRLNLLKAKILDTFCFVTNSPQPIAINLDYASWAYDELYGKVIFPFDPALKPPNPKAAFREWSKFLTSNNLHFVKPSKTLFQKPKQKALYDSVIKKINSDVAPITGISKIYLMGSTAKETMGFYKSPFIHSEWSKLGSDIDLLIEIDETKGFVPPETWKYINISTTNRCDIYHIGQIPISDVYGYKKQYPNIAHFGHLLDAYVYFPSKGDMEKKDAFLKRFNADLVFDKSRDGGIMSALEAAFGEPVTGLRKLDVATENEIFEADIAGRTDILKVYRVSGNYNSAKLAEHVDYECEVIRAVQKLGVNIASVRIAKDGRSALEINGAPAILFEKLVGEEVAAPAYPVVETAQALARFHQAQIDSPVEIKADFSFNASFDIWHAEFERFRGESTDDEELSACFNRLAPIYKSLKKLYRDMTRRKQVAWVHNHGDVQPRNVIMKDQQAYLFDFQNAFYGPRLLDLAEGAIEFSWGFKNPDDNDFARFDRFMEAYLRATPLSGDEQKSLDNAIKVVGVIKFIKEVRMTKGDKNKNNLRRRRAVDLAAYLLSRFGKGSKN